jgi:hypothetical protein
VLKNDEYMTENILNLGLQHLQSEEVMLHIPVASQKNSQVTTYSCQQPPQS